MFHKNKAGKLSTSVMTTIALVIITILILFQVYAELVPEVGDAGDEMNDTARCVDAGGYWNHTDDSCDVSIGNATSLAYTSIPLAGLFTSSGMVLLIIMAAFLIVIVRGVMRTGK